MVQPPSVQVYRVTTLGRVGPIDPHRTFSSWSSAAPSAIRHGWWKKIMVEDFHSGCADVWDVDTGDRLLFGSPIVGGFGDLGGAICTSNSSQVM